MIEYDESGNMSMNTSSDMSDIVGYINVFMTLKIIKTVGIW